MLQSLRRAGLIWPMALSVAGLAVLISLGTWQLQRKHWKDQLIANSQPAPIYVPETRYYAPEPRYYAPPRDRIWIQGHYESRVERQWVPGHWEISRNRPDADDEFGDGDGGDGGRGHRNWVVGHYQTIERQVWIPAHWEDRG